jgi:hypothetical protein
VPWTTGASTTDRGAAGGSIRDDGGVKEEGGVYRTPEPVERTLSVQPSRKSDGSFRGTVRLDLVLDDPLAWRATLRSLVGETR